MVTEQGDAHGTFRLPEQAQQRLGIARTVHPVGGLRRQGCQLRPAQRNGGKVRQGTGGGARTHARGQERQAAPGRGSPAGRFPQGMATSSWQPAHGNHLKAASPWQPSEGRHLVANRPWFTHVPASAEARQQDQHTRHLKRACLASARSWCSTNSTAGRIIYHSCMFTSWQTVATATLTGDLKGN